MNTAKEIRDFLNKFCPETLAFDRDNVGMLVGRASKEIKKALVTLDVDESVVNEAIEKGAQIIISHHPLMFYPINRLTDADHEQRTLALLISSDIAHVCAHTNLDCVQGGLNDFLAKKLGIKDTKVIQVSGEFGGHAHGFGRIGTVEDGVTLAQMLERCTKALDCKGVRYVGDPQRIVKKVAVNCGGGADALGECILMGADLFITGDVKYNPARDAAQQGMALIDAGHYETEHIVIELFTDILSAQFPDIEFVPSASNVPVFRYFVK